MWNGQRPCFVLFERKVAEVSATPLLEASFFQKLMPDEDKKQNWTHAFHFVCRLPQSSTVYSLFQRFLWFRSLPSVETFQIFSRYRCTWSVITDIWQELRNCISRRHFSLSWAGALQFTRLSVNTIFANQAGDAHAKHVETYLYRRFRDFLPWITIGVSNSFEVFAPLNGTMLLGKMPVWIVRAWRKYSRMSPSRTDQIISFCILHCRVICRELWCCARFLPDGALLYLCSSGDENIKGRKQKAAWNLAMNAKKDEER